ncbi:meiosis inhibitor protein 1-like [Mya arenaria]|uniref:meiosis inhibitor protein 1-like n=1 Tax=Mya arenaria TaxID=6604 RepID=UPI0022E74159|nr:meiosis inhibitor protein 1-like [Mya arenaria]
MAKFQSLLKKLIQGVGGVAGLMSVQAGDQSLLACIKRLLLSKQEVLQVGACHVLAQLLDPVAGETYGPQVLQSDLVEFLFEALNTEQTFQIESIFKVLKTLSGLGQFYKRCHAVYGVESLLRAVTVAKEMKNPHLLELGFSVLAQVLTKHPSDMPLFVSPGVVQKCLCVVRGGLEHQQPAVFYQAMDTLTPLLSKNYLLTPIPFDDLGDLVTKATTHVWADLGQRSGTKRGQGDRHMWVEQTQKCMEMLSSCVKLCLECAGDHSLCESSFAVPDMDDQSGSSSEKFVHTVLAAVDDMGIPLMMLSWERGDSPEWYIQCLNLLADLDDLDTMATSELLYKLLTAGFLTSLLELKQQFNSGILTRSIGNVLSLLLICCQSKGLLPSNMDMPGRFTLDGLNWKVADLQEVFGGSVLPQSVVESYLLLLYIDLQLENRILSPEQLAALAQAIVDHQCAVDQLSPLAQKHFIYLLAYVCVAGSCNISCIISNGVGSVARLMEGRMEDWYTHNPVLLHWVFLDPILAGTCRHSVVGVSSVARLMEGRIEDWYTHNPVLLHWDFLDPILAGTCGHSVVGVGSVARLMERRMEDWYTHNPVLLHWVFLDPILAGTCGHSVVGVGSVAGLMERRMEDWYTHNSVLLHWVFLDPILAGTCRHSVVGVGSVARLMEGRMEDWYTHNPVLLHWVFLDPILAGTCRHSVVGVGSVARLMEGRMEDWYTHNPVLLHWDFLDPILAGTCGHSVVGVGSVARLMEGRMDD